MPEYGKAVDQAATEIGAKQARDFASTVLRPGTSRSTVAEEIADMSAAELRHLREGLRQSIDDTIANVTRVASDGNVDAREAVKAVRDLSSRASREKLEAVLGKDAATALAQRVDEAATALELRAGVATNSRTFGRQQTDRIIRDRLNDGPVEAAMRGEPVNVGKRAVQALTGRTAADNAAREEQVYAEIARILTGPRGAQAQDALQLLQQIAATRPINDAMAARIGTGGAAALGLPAYLAARQSTEAR